MNKTSKQAVAVDSKSPVELALQSARHELTTLHGLWATDRPDQLANKENYFQVDTTEAIVLLDKAIESLPGNGNHLS